MCERCKKVPYNSRRHALTDAPERHGTPYRCKECGYWHVGHAWAKKSALAVKVKNRRRGTRALFRLIDQLCGSECA